MELDYEYLKEHYASLSDNALLAVNRDDLEEAARDFYDYELKERGLVRRQAPPPEPPTEEPEDREPDQEFDKPAPSPDALEKPDWLPEAAVVLSLVELPGLGAADNVADARDALDGAGIPCFVDTYDEHEDATGPSTTHLWRLLVPGNDNIYATSILERDIYNKGFENDWKTHLEMLTDDEVLALKPEKAFCGLFDRVARVTRTYEEELVRRGLK